LSGSANSETLSDDSVKTLLSYGVGVLLGEAEDQIDKFLTHGSRGIFDIPDWRISARVEVKIAYPVHVLL
jgi:hypothetical protein